MSLRVTCVVVAVALLGVSLVAAQFTDSESEDLELSLPDFPAPPARDRGMLHMRGADELVTPRFRAVHADEDEAGDEAEGADEQEAEQGEAEADADAEGEADEQEQEQAEAEVTEEIVSEEAEDDNAPRFAAAASPMQMRFASAMQRRYDTNALPAGPLPVAAARTSNDLARVPVSAVGDALFTPIHNSVRQYPGATPAASLAGGANSYAWGSQVQPRPTYAYGNLNWGAPVNAQFYPKPPAAPVAPVAAAKPAAAPKKKAKKAEAEAEEGAEAEETAEDSFVELSGQLQQQQRVHQQMQQQMQQWMQQQQRMRMQAQAQAQAQAAAQAQAQAAAAAQAQAASQQLLTVPYAPHLAPRGTPARDARADLLQSGYQSYSRANWPSSVPPPAAYYLPPDVAI